MTAPRAAFHNLVPPLIVLVATSLAGCPVSSDIALGRFELGLNVGGAPTPATVSGPPVFRSEPVFEAVAGKVGSHAPTIAAFNDGELLAAWYSYDGPYELDGAMIYAARRARDGGVWEVPELLVQRATPVGNPVLYIEGDNVWLFYAVVPGAWSLAHTELVRSVDRGRTWSAPRTVSDLLGTNVRYPPVRTMDGGLLLPAYDDFFSRALFFASRDGDDWFLRSVVATAPPYRCIQPSLAVLGDGRLLSIMRNTGTGWLWVTVSADSGERWAAPVEAGFPNPGSASALLRLASGNLVLIYNDSNTARRPLSITLSADEGRTWYAGRVLVDGEGAYAYPAACQAPDGIVYIVYSHNRERIQHIELNEAWIVANAVPGDGDDS